MVVGLFCFCYCLIFACHFVCWLVVGLLFASLVFAGFVGLMVGTVCFRFVVVLCLFLFYVFVCFGC